jgi:hypothetical protein
MSVGASFDGRLLLGGILGAEAGAGVFVSVPLTLPLRVEASLSAMRLIGWEIGGQLTALWEPLRTGIWNPSLGPSAGLSFGSQLTLFTQSSTAPISVSLGPSVAWRVGVVLAPLDFRLEGYSISTLRLGAFWEPAASAACWVLDLEIIRIGVDL